MKLARSLIEGKFDNCFVLTFNADLPFFERMIFGHLYGNDCRNLVILMDPDHYVEELKSSIPILNYVGQRYVCAPATGVSGVRFHPKLILQTSETQGRLFLGSGNLSQPGLTRNWEVVTRLDYSTKDPDSTALMVFRSLLRYLRRLAESPGLPKLVRRRTNRLIASTPWIVPLDQAFEWPRGFRILDNLDQPLWDQVIAAVSIPVQGVRILSPYFDPVCQAFRRLIGDLRPRSICLYIQPDHHNLDAQQLYAVVDSYEGQFEVRALDLGNRRLHAKAVQFETEQGVWLLTGSANFSVAGLMRSARFGNAELGSLRYEQDLHYFDARWDEIHQRSHPIGIDWETPLAGDEPPDERPVARPMIVLSSATLDALGMLRLRCGSGLLKEISNVRLEFAAADTSIWKVDTWQLDGNVLSVHLPDRWCRRLEKPWLVSLHLETSREQLSSLPVLVHHTGQLYRYSRPPRRGGHIPIPERLEIEDYSQLLELMHLFQRLFISKRSEIDDKAHRISGTRRRTDRDVDDLPEGDYDPEDQVADERVRYPDGSIFYRRYYDRVTFRDLMRAALRASYQAPKELRPSTSQPQKLPSVLQPSGGEPPEPARKPEPAPPVTEDAQRARFMEEMNRGLQRLIKRFGESAGDGDYLSVTPPCYLCDFFYGIMQFMGVVQDAGLLESARYAQLSTDLLVAFYGLPGHVGVWPRLKGLHPSNILGEIESHTGIHVRSWVLLYQSWRLLNVLDLRARQERHRWRLGAVARRIVKEIGDKDQRHELATLLEEQAIRLWPEEADRPSFYDFKTVLLNAARHYHIDLVSEELKQAGARSVSVQFWDGVHPDLHVTIPIKNLETPRLLSAFQKFVRIHRTKPKIRAQFKEPSVVSDQHGRSVIFMYDQDEALLVYAVRYELPGDPDRYDVNLDLRQLQIEDLLSFQLPKDILNWPHQKDYTRKNAD